MSFVEVHVVSKGSHKLQIPPERTCLLAIEESLGRSRVALPPLAKAGRVLNLEISVAIHWMALGI